MIETENDFDARIRSLGRKHRAMLKTGGALRVRQDGLMVLKPKRAVSAHGFVPIRAIAVLMLGFFAAKGFLLASLDGAEYGARLNSLSSGTMVEQVGARLMKPDAVSLLFAGAIVDLKEQWRKGGARS